MQAIHGDHGFAKEERKQCCSGVFGKCAAVVLFLVVVGIVTAFDIASIVMGVKYRNDPCIHTDTRINIAWGDFLVVSGSTRFGFLVLGILFSLCKSQVPRVVIAVISRLF